MAEPTKAPEPKPIERSLVSDYLTELRNKIFGDKYLGKNGYNPHTWWKETGMKDLETRFNEGSTEQGLYRQILAVQFSEPVAKNPTSLPVRKFPVVGIVPSPNVK